MRHILETAKGWKRRGIAALLGICATAALPPLYILPLLIPSFAGLFLLVHHAPSRRQAFLDGWWWGLGYFVTGLYWMSISLYVNPEKFAWLTPFALFGVPSVLAIYIGLVTLALYCVGGTLPPVSLREISPAGSSYKTPPRTHVPYIVLFAALWVGAEYLRAHLFTGFPWNLIGYVWTVSDATLQLASVADIYGLSWITVIIATMPALFLLRDGAALRANITTTAMLVCMVALGCWRLDTYPTHYTPTRIRIVQANIQESMKWNPDTELYNLKKHAGLTRSPGLEKVDIVLWPETSVPYFMEPNSPLTRDLGSLLPEHALLITGGLRGKGGKGDWQAWNSLFAINSQGHIIAEYDKHHLVPFGEFIPFRHILPIEKLTGGMGDFSRGTGPATLSAGVYPPYSPLICYEVIFPDEATDDTHRAKWLLNVTNDAWFGKSSGPWQHLEMARTRAVEQGLPLVRAANTGISAVFDPLGRMLASLPLGREGVLDLKLPESGQDTTIISRCPYSPVLLMIVLSAVLILITL